MNKQTQQKAAQRRAKRTTASKAKRKERNVKGVKILPGKRPVRNNEALTALAMALSRSNLEDPLSFIMKGGKSDGEFDPEELHQTTRKALGEVYKLFTYVCLAERLKERNVIEHDFTCDLDRITNELIVIDKQVQRLPALIKADLESFVVEVLDIGGYVENQADLLYTEIEALDKYSLTIEDRLNKSAHDFQVAHPEVTEQDARLVVMETISQERLNKFRQQQKQAELTEV